MGITNLLFLRDRYFGLRPHHKVSTCRFLRSNFQQWTNKIAWFKKLEFRVYRLPINCNAFMRSHEFPPFAAAIENPAFSWCKVSTVFNKAEQNVMRMQVWRETLHTCSMSELGISPPSKVNHHILQFFSLQGFISDMKAHVANRVHPHLYPCRPLHQAFSVQRVRVV
jgi:hypothetical protein